MNESIENQLVQTSFCLFSCIEFCAYENGINVDAMFASCPTFNILKYKKGSFPELRLSFAKSPIDICNEYLGLKVEEIHIPGGDDITDLSFFLKKSFPCISCIDAFWCSWTKFYEKKHISHYIVLLDLDRDGNIVCFDPFISGKQHRLSLNDYLKYLNSDERLLMYEFKQMYKLQKTTNIYRDCFEELKRTACYILDNHMIEDMETYLGILRNDSQITNNLEEMSYLDEGFLDLLTVAKTRKDFYRALLSSHSFNGNSELGDIIAEYEGLLKVWISLEQNLLLLSIVKDERRRNSIWWAIFQKLEKIIMLEKSIYTSLACINAI